MFSPVHMLLLMSTHVLALWPSLPRVFLLWEALQAEPSKLSLSSTI